MTASAKCTDSKCVALTDSVQLHNGKTQSVQSDAGRLMEPHSPSYQMNKNGRESDDSALQRLQRDSHAGTLKPVAVTLIKITSLSPGLVYQLEGEF